MTEQEEKDFLKMVFKMIEDERELEVGLSRL